ncbi:MAG: hypothetical protein C0623_05025 [Desulfuromonas sp.]|nr:MAG: hypothetical protein C0623_05025 [Desulfuromonas sp.]
MIKGFRFKDRTPKAFPLFAFDFLCGVSLRLCVSALRKIFMNTVLTHDYNYKEAEKANSFWGSGLPCGVSLRLCVKKDFD